MTSASSASTTTSTPLLTVQDDLRNVTTWEQEADPANRRLFPRGAAQHVVPLGKQNASHPWGEDAAAIWQKYSLLVRVIMITAVSIGIRLILDAYAWPDHAPWDKTAPAATAGGYFDFTFVAPLFTSCMFVAGLLLSGVLADCARARAGSADAVPRTSFAISGTTIFTACMASGTLWQFAHPPRRRGAAEALVAPRWAAK